MLGYARDGSPTTRWPPSGGGVLRGLTPAETFSLTERWCGVATLSTCTGRSATRGGRQALDRRGRGHDDDRRRADRRRFAACRSKSWAGSGTTAALDGSRRSWSFRVELPGKGSSCGRSRTSASRSSARQVTLFRRQAAVRTARRHGDGRHRSADGGEHHVEEDRSGADAIVLDVEDRRRRVHEDVSRARRLPRRCASSA